MSIAKSLGFEPVVFIAQIVIFLVLLQVLDRLFWRPFMAHLEGRDNDIKQAYETVERTRRDMEALRADYQKRIGQIEAEARGRIQAAIKDAQSERERIIAEARAQAETALTQGVADMEREKTDTLAAMEREMASLGLLAVDKALGGIDDPVSLSNLMEQVVARRRDARA